MVVLIDKHISLGLVGKAERVAAVISDEDDEVSHFEAQEQFIGKDHLMPATY